MISRLLGLLLLLAVLNIALCDSTYNKF
jgi:hypothetical protein